MSTDGIIDNEQMLTSMDVGVRSATAGNREDLLDVITITSPADTPLLSGLQKAVCRATTHEWLIDSLEARGDPSLGDADVEVTPEGSDATFSTPASRKRLSNLTHIFRKTVDVSDTQRAVLTAGIDDEYIYQLQKQLMNLALAMEYAILHSLRNDQSVVGNSSGSPATGRKMCGILGFLEPDPSGVSADYLTDTEEGTITICGSPWATLTEAIYNDHLDAMWQKGCLPNVAYCNSVQKRTISGFTTNVYRNVDAKEMIQYSAVDVYDGDFGRQVIVLHRDMYVREVLTLDESYWRLALLRPVLQTDLAKVGNSSRAMVEGELTLECRAPNTGGKIVDCSQTYGAVA